MKIVRLQTLLTIQTPQTYSGHQLTKLNCMNAPLSTIYSYPPPLHTLRTMMLSVAADSDSSGGDRSTTDGGYHGNNAFHEKASFAPRSMSASVPSLGQINENDKQEKHREAGVKDWGSRKTQQSPQLALLLPFVPRLVSILTLFWHRTPEMGTKHFYLD